MITMQAERARRTRDDGEFVRVAMASEFWGTRVFIPASIVLIASGLGMVGAGHISFSKPFVDIGFAGWALSFLVGSAYLGPQAVKVKEMTAVNGTVNPVVLARVGRILWVARVDLVILLLVVVVSMAVKPGGGV